MKKTSKFTFLSLFFLFCNLFLITNCAQNYSIRNSDFEAINQFWIGQLEYLNYSDDKSIVKIPCTLKTDFVDGKIDSVIDFDEKDGNGKKMRSETSFYLSNDGKYFMIDKEKWEIISSENTNQQIKIIATKKGKDNNRSAEMKITWVLKKDKSISWKKDIRYEGTNAFFNRNIFSFSKK